MKNIKGAGLLLAGVVGLAVNLACPRSSNTGDGGGPLARGARLYTLALPTAAGEAISCAACHGEEGNGGSAPSLREENTDHLLSHAQGGGTHPEGVKYLSLTRDDFAAMAAFLGGETGANDNHDPGFDELIGDAERGEAVFSTLSPTSGGGAFHCAVCHGANGASGFGPDVRGQAADHLQAHARGDGRHPSGIKFPELTAQDFVDMAAFLSGDQHDEHGEHEPDGDHADHP